MSDHPFFDLTHSSVSPSENRVHVEPVHIHMKQLYNSYSFFPVITYYRKCIVDVGKVSGHLASNALLGLANDVDNWLFSFDAAQSKETPSFVGVSSMTYP